MQIQSAQTAQFTGTAASEQTLVLKSRALYSGIRISCTGSGTGHHTKMLDALNSLVLDVPEYGSRSRRVDVNSDTKWMLPIMSQLSALSQADANAATSLAGSSGDNLTASFAYIDLPVNKLNLEEDVRLTINCTPGTAATAVQTFHISFLDYAFRDIYFRPFFHAAAASSVQQWFPSDGVLRGVVAVATDGSEAAGSWAEARSSSTVTQVSLNGEQSTTFSFPQLLGAGLDEAISGGTPGEYYAIDSYSMLKTFPIQNVAQYVDVTRGASKGLLIMGVMSDA